MNLPVLPTHYYVDHFHEMLSFVEHTYAAILDPSHREFVTTFRALTADEQRLLVRLINRRRQVFERTTLRYAEISNIDIAIDGLMRGQFIRALDVADYGEWLCSLNKQTLIDVARKAGFDGAKVSWIKSRLIDYVLTNVPFSCARTEDAVSCIVLVPNESLEYMLYLYFGKLQDDLKSFALRDLGILRTNDTVSFKARFADAAEAKACFYYSQLLDRLRSESLESYETAVQSLRHGPSDGGDHAHLLRARAALQVGQFFERQKEIALAIETYSLAPSPECSERLVRLLYAQGEKADARSHLERMIDDPDSDDQFTFAVDFYQRKFNGCRTSTATDLLRSGETIIVDDIYRGNPETGAAGVMRRNGARVYFSENTLWHNVFGLLFWEELFESGQLGCGFDWIPHCLTNGSFATAFASELERKLSAVRRGEAMPILLRSIAEYWGRPNGIVSWSAIGMEAVRDLLTFANAPAVATILELMARDFRAMRDGFPDLMILNDGAIRFAEIKSQGDAIRRNQLTRLRQMQSTGLSAVILRADYRFDGDQDYVVVDIETTGGWAASDRVIEIGAVKVRNHQVVGEWQSLVYPGRAIPASITRLTGITNAMVCEAPTFPDIAEGFRDFMGDGIFVAHNVNFDFGFLAQEYARLDTQFRFPKFCTCAGMRRHHPGHRSYSLVSLCETYGLSLKNHHRALCDAKATVGLLNLINRKREAEALLPRKTTDS
jgi:DNA polymerase-3 subunit epsilon